MSDNESSDDDIGPMPTGMVESADLTTKIKKPVKKKRKLAFSQVYANDLPRADLYERSYMHRDVVSHIAVSKNAEFVVSASRDGHVKFWKKVQEQLKEVERSKKITAKIMKKIKETPQDENKQV